MDSMFKLYWKDDELKALSEKLSDSEVQNEIRDLGLRLEKERLERERLEREEKERLAREEEKRQMQEEVRKKQEKEKRDREEREKKERLARQKERERQEMLEKEAERKRVEAEKEDERKRVESEKAKKKKAKRKLKSERQKIIQNIIQNIKQIIGNGNIFIPYYKKDEGQELKNNKEWRYLSTSYTNDKLNDIVDPSERKFADRGEITGGNGLINYGITSTAYWYHSIQLQDINNQINKYWRDYNRLKKLNDKLSDKDVQSRIRKLGLSNFNYKTKYLKQSGGGKSRWVNNHGFSIQIDKFVIYRLIESLNEADKKGPGKSVDFFSGSYHTRYIHNNKGQLVNEKSERYDEGSFNFNKMSRVDNCYTTNIKVKSPQACQDYVEKCLLGSDVSDCYDWLKSPQFWTQIESEINKMNPKIAVLTLNKFGFKIYNSRPNKKMEVETYSSWSKNLDNNKYLSYDQVKNIRNNIYLESYLKAIIHLINYNSDILNKRDSNRLHNKSIYKYGIPSKLNTNSLKSSNLMRLHNSIVTNNNFINMSWNSNNMSGGGSRDEYVTWNEMFEKHPNYIANKMRKYFSAFDRRLEKNNKKIARNDSKLVKKLVDKLGENEAKLYKTIAFLEKYTLLLNLFGNNNKEVLNFDTVTKYVKRRDKYFDKTSKLQNNISLMLANLAISTEDIKKQY